MCIFTDELRRRYNILYQYGQSYCGSYMQAGATPSTENEFFRFQTSAGVLALSGYSPEDYMYDKLSFDKSYNRITGWEPEVCPPDVTQDFGIGSSPKQVNLPK